MIEIATWNVAPGELTLHEHDVHIWKSSLATSEAEAAALATYLSEDELARAARFVFPRDRRRFIVGRGRLRQILGKYLGCPPERLGFQNGAFGKPSLASPYGEIHFNLSHSSEIAVYAFVLKREIGIDIETVQAEFAGDEIARRYFSEAEQLALRGLSAEERALSFFVCWTRKEAYVKARGGGLQIPLDSFNVSVTPDETAQLWSIDSERWTMFSFSPATKFIASVVVERPLANVQFWDFGAFPRN